MWIFSLQQAVVLVAHNHRVQFWCTAYSFLEVLFVSFHRNQTNDSPNKSGQPCSPAPSAPSPLQSVTGKVKMGGKTWLDDSTAQFLLNLPSSLSRSPPHLCSPTLQFSLVITISLFVIFCPLHPLACHLKTALITMRTLAAWNGGET